MSASLLRGDALHLPLRDASVDLIVTSPPYFALRSYRDGDEHYAGQIGSEPTPQAFLEALWAVTAECWRVLKPSGSLWVNLGDKRSGSGGPGTTTQLGTPGKSRPQKDRTGLAATENGIQGGHTYTAKAFGRAKSKMLLPHRYAIGCEDGMADPDGIGWVVRQDQVWAKPNGLPESVRDRTRDSHEYWFHLTREGRYFADLNPIRETTQGRPCLTWDERKAAASSDSRARYSDQNGHGGSGGMADNPLGKVPDSVWSVATEPLIVPESLGVDHFAAFPSEWPRRIISGWSPSGVCTVCGEGRRSVAEKHIANPAYSIDQRERTTVGGGPPSGGGVTRTITGEECACPTADAPTRPAVVLDPFGGTGTTAAVANALGRHGISLDMSADYCRLAAWRTTDPGLRAKVLRVDPPAKQVEGQASLFGASS